jgi:phage terminase large subunit
VNAEFPSKLEFLFAPHRYKVPYGGRGGSKSWAIARALLLQGAGQPLRILCAREIQKSIADSVHHLLESQVSLLELDWFYKVEKAKITGQNGTEFIFSGLRDTANLKSYEAVDICWVEEAQNVSKRSWDILIPTIRKEGSEIWISFNPELDTDETYSRFVLNSPPDAKVVKLNWSDNPWFPEVLRKEKDYLKSKDYNAYLTVWEGHCKQVLDGAIYEKELLAATSEGRICNVPYDRSKPVHTFWDLGWSDNTSIWFAQVVGFEYRVIDFYQNTQFALDHYLGVLQQRGYVYGTDWLPHDAAAKQLGTGRSIEEQARAFGRTVRITPKLSVADGINAARTIFPQCYFDKAKCQDGLQNLRRYCFDVDPETGQFKKEPRHDLASHAADAFRYLAVGLQADKIVQKQAIVVKPINPALRSTSWMR